MEKSFRRFLIIALAIIATVVVCDFCLGKAMNWVMPQISNQGDTGKTYFSLNEVDTPIVIVGSSRAAHHYVSSMISDSLGYETYNVGRDGCFFSYNYCVINSILDRYSPRLIIWENSMDCLYESSADPLENLYPYYGVNPWVTECIDEDYSMAGRVSLISNMYKYNSILHRIVSRFIHKDTIVDRTKCGYDPLVPKVNQLILSHSDHHETTISQLKRNRLLLTLKRAQNLGVKIVMVDSPIYKEMAPYSKSQLELRNICNEYNALLLNNTQLEEFHKCPEYFNDHTHLNDYGAKEYTKVVIEQISAFQDNILCKNYR